MEPLFMVIDVVGSGHSSALSAGIPSRAASVLADHDWHGYYLDVAAFVNDSAGLPGQTLVHKEFVIVRLADQDPVTHSNADYNDDGSGD